MSMIGENPFWATAAQIVQQDLEEVGFKVKLQAHDAASQEELLSAGEFEASTGELYDAVPSPSEPVGFYNGLEGLWTGAPTAQTTKIAEAAASEVDPKKREALYQEFQQVLDRGKYLVPVVYLPFAWAHRTDVSGFQVGTTGTPWFAETGLVE
jgi:ABC-type transport system substrate-binding protein